MSHQARVDRAFMQGAIGLARFGQGTTAPNPSVGALVVRGDAIVGKGTTQPVGGPHAEIMALRDAGDARGATVYVTLEPCGHHGRTPPCTDALIAAGVTRVVVGTLDPFEPMRGKSLDTLRAAGIEVTLGIEREACDRLILGFARAITRGLPEVTVKAATSADGRIATASGESQWITADTARSIGHQMRAAHDAVLVGIGTVLADDPRLTVRIDGLEGRTPTPVVLDTWLRLPDTAHLNRPGTLVLCGEEAPDRALRAEVLRLPTADGRVDVEAALALLAARGLHRVLVEGGGEVIRSLLDAGLVDTVEQFVAGIALPGGRPWVGGPAVPSLAAAPHFRLAQVERAGPDAWLTWHATHVAPPDRPEEA